MQRYSLLQKDQTEYIFIAPDCIVVPVAANILIWVVRVVGDCPTIDTKYVVGGLLFMLVP